MIVVKITDGLGNQMFQYAYARNLQQRIGQKVYLDVSDINKHICKNTVAGDLAQFCGTRKYSLNQFSIVLPTLEGWRLSRIRRQLRNENRFIRYCREFRVIPEQGTKMHLDEKGIQRNNDVFLRHMDYYLEGFFFDIGYLKKNENILRKEFQLKNKLNVPENINYILQVRNTISIHIRRSDFRRIGRDMSESIYYDKAISYMENRVDHPFFIIFSDDIEWVKNNKKFTSDHMYISGRGFSDSEELMIMSMCRHHIIANSTYSYWGAWLNSSQEKIVVAPHGWKEKIIPDTWILL